MTPPDKIIIAIAILISAPCWIIVARFLAVGLYGAWCFLFQCIGAMLGLCEYPDMGVD